MTIEEKNKVTMIRGTKEIVRKLKLVSALRGNGETIGILIGSLVDKEMQRLGLKGNSDE
jgi:hypothetical protein